jgi:hypothetical protein
MPRGSGVLLLLLSLLAIASGGGAARAACPTPALTDCTAPDWPHTECGYREWAATDAYLTGASATATACAVECGTVRPDAARCSAAAWSESVCGRIQARRALLELDAARAQGEIDWEAARWDAFCLTPCLAAEGSLTLAQCLDEGWLATICGAIGKWRWDRGLERYDATGGALDAGYHSRCLELTRLADPQPPLAPHTVETTIWPCRGEPGPDGCPDGDVCAAHAEDCPWVRQEVRRERFQRAGQDFVGLETSYQGVRARTWTRASSAAPGSWATGGTGGGRAIPVLPWALAAVQRAEWAANGLRVSSCAEYVYEKYYDYSLFEDATQSLGADWRAVFQVAFYGTADVSPDAPSPDPKAGGSWGAQLGATSLGTAAQAALEVDRPRAAIGWWGLRHEPVRSKDGVPLARQIDFPPGPAPRNVFFQTDGHFAGPEERPVDPRLLTASGRCGFDPTYLTICDPTVVGPQGQTLRDVLLASYAEAAARPPSAPESWEWHWEKSEELAAAGYLDEELYLRERLREEFAQALHRWIEQRSQLWRLSETVGPLAWAEVSGWDPSIVATAPLDPISWVLAGQRDDLFTAGNLALGARAGAPTGARKAIGWGAATPFQVAGFGELGFDRLRRRSVYDPDTLHGFLSSYAESHGPEFLLKLAILRTEARLERLFAEAVELGCLEADPDAPNPCDWTPRHFAQRVLDLYSAEREGDYRTCRRNTGRDGFAGLAGADLGIPAEFAQPGGQRYQAVWFPVVPTWDNHELGADMAVCWVRPQTLPISACADGACAPADFLWLGPPAAHPTVESLQPEYAWPDPNDGCQYGLCLDLPGRNQWDASTTLVDYYFLCLDAYKQLVLDIVEAAVGDLSDLQDESGRVHLRDAEGSSWAGGDEDVFAVQGGYGFGWGIGGFSDFLLDEGTRCSLTPEVYGFLGIGVAVLGEDFWLLDASLHARGPGLPAFETLPAQVVPGELRVAVLGMNLFDPLSLAAGGGEPVYNVIQDEARLDQDFVQVSQTFLIDWIPVTVAAGLAGYMGVAYEAGLELTAGTGNQPPEACARMVLFGGFGPFAGVEAYASASVNLAIIEAGVKIYVTIVRVDLPFHARVALSLNELTIEAGLELVMSFLSGRFSAFVRVLWETWEEVLFEWDGLRWAVSLFNVKATFPLTILRDALCSVPEFELGCR